MKQTTNTVLMIEPTNFCLNHEAAVTNSFQKQADGLTSGQVQATALAEFRQMAARLQEAGIDVMVVQDFENSQTPDSIFPNNWISTHQDGKLITYPMAPANRRPERRQDIIDLLHTRFNYAERIAMHTAEDLETPRFLEGTGSIVLDRRNKVAYAALSPRTDLHLFRELCEILTYKPVTFHAYGLTGELIYHTNVMLCIGETFAVVGLEVVAPEDRQKLLDQFNASGLEIIELTEHQTHHSFAGNMLQLENNKGEKILVMSEAAYTSLTPVQLATLEKHNSKLLSFPVHLIEKCGGGSVRCMIAEIFKPAQV